MNSIRLLNKISPCGTDLFDRAKYAVGEEIENPDAIMVRSAAMHDMVFGDRLLAIARCGAGVNNIPCDRCADEGIPVFNTPGANANGVKELTIAALILAARDIVGGIEWVKGLEGTADIAKQVEKGKSKFAGNELEGKTLGVIGLGAIGAQVANAAIALGMNVIGSDPYVSVHAALALSPAVKLAPTVEELYAKSDYITLHVPATPQTKGMICASAIAQMKDGVRILNLARADLAVAEDVKAALAAGKIKRYVTDFPTDETVGVPGIIAIPHLGASTEESEDNCAVMAAEELMEYIECGNIRNSVNYPAVSLPKSSLPRLAVLHRNVPDVISGITSVLGDAGVNIESMANGSKGAYAYTLLELNSPVTDAICASLTDKENIIRVRAL